MKIRNKIISVILSLSCISLPAAAEADSPSVGIVMPAGSDNILEYDAGYFFLDFAKNLPAGSYKTDCILDGEVIKSFDINIQTGIKMVKRVELPVLKKGMHTLSLTVNGEAFGETAFAAVETYKKQPGDEFSRIGINTHIKASEDITTLSRGGAINMRQSMYWNAMEKEKKVYSAADYQYIKNAFEKCGTVCLFEGAFGNPVYYAGMENTKWNTPPKTREQIDAYAEYVVETLKSFPQIRKVEIWNEPNLTSSGRAANMTSSEYTQMVKRTAMAIRDYDPTVIIMCGALANQSSIEFTNDMLELGAADFVDGISIHPYCYPNNPDERFIEKAADNWLPAYEYGGWLEMYATEMGFPNHINVAGITEEKSAVYFPKMYVLGDYAGYGELYWHNGVNNGWDAYNREDNFGILRADYTPKPAFCSMSQLCRMLNNARYIGMYHPADGMNAYCYVKEGKPVMVCWSPAGEVQYNFGAFARVEDMFGNVLDSELTVGEEPVYVTGISEAVLAKAAAAMAGEGYRSFIEKWQNIADVSAISALAAEVGKYRNRSIAEVVKKHYRAGDSFIKQYAEGKIELEQMTCMLYNLHETGERLCAFYAASGVRVSQMSAEQRLQSVNKAISSIKDGNKYASIRFTERMVKCALVAIDRGTKILNGANTETINSYAAADNLMADMLLNWAEQLMQLEECNHNAGILTYMYPAKLSTFLGRSSSVQLSVDNRTNRDIDADVLWYDDRGNQVGEAIPVTIKKGDAEEYDLPVDISMEAELGNHIYEARITANGETMARQWLDVAVASAASVKLEPATEAFTNLNKIEISVTNSYDDDITGTLTVTPPEGWTLSGASRKISVENGETKIFTFDIAAKTRAAYNEYVFGIELKDDSGAILSDKHSPLDFLVITETADAVSPSGFDGDMSVWNDAYPIHIGVPEQAQSRDAWYKSNRSARAYAKFDAQNFYMLVDVYDDYSSQFYTGYDMWRGDSIQVSFDVLNSDGTAYSPDDFEYGFSYTSGGDSVYAYHRGNESSGDVDGDCLKIIRDGDRKITRYLIKLPKAMLGKMKLEAGHEFGFNICINDADIMERDAYIQFTTGTGNKKLPADYKTFRLAKAESNTAPVSDDMLTTRINQTQYFDY